MLPPPIDGTAPPLVSLAHGLVDLCPVLATGLWSTEFAAPVRWRLPATYLAALTVGALLIGPDRPDLSPDAGPAMAALILGSAVSLGLTPPAWMVFVTVAALGALQGASEAEALPTIRLLAAGALAICLGAQTGPVRRCALLRGLSGLCALGGLAVFVRATRM